jgi:hypothetical protein
MLFVIPCHGQEATQDDATGSGELGKGWMGLGPSLSRQAMPSHCHQAMHMAISKAQQPDGSDIRPEDRPEEGPLLK